MRNLIMDLTEQVQSSSPLVLYIHDINKYLIQANIHVVIGSDRSERQCEISSWRWQSKFNHHPQFHTCVRQHQQQRITN